MSLIKNAAPEVIQLGTDDKSQVLLPAEITELGCHVPKFYDFFQKGKVGATVVDGAKLVKFYGDASFDREKKWFNKTKPFIEATLGQGGVAVIHRLIDPNIKSLANITIYLDILKTKVKLWERYTDGTIVRDENGNKVAKKDDDGNDIEIDGYVFKLIAEYTDMKDDDKLGRKGPKTGTMKDDDDNTSIMYPILERRATSYGEYYNNLGLAIEVVDEDEVIRTFIETTKQIPYNLRLFEKKEGFDTVIRNLYNNTSVNFLFKPIKTATPDTNMDFASMFKTYYNESNEELAYKPFDELVPYVYLKNIEHIADLVLQYEKDYINTDYECKDGVANTADWFDFIYTDKLEDQRLLINLLGGVSIKRKEYVTYQYAEDYESELNERQEEVFSNINVPIYLKNGDDGDTSMELLEKLIRKEMDRYLDPDDSVQNLARNPENIIYDVGYTIETKKALAKFIGVRKDTVVVLSTYTPELENKIHDYNIHKAVAMNLKSRLALYPESTYFGTHVARAVVVMGAGNIKTENSDEFYPLTYDIAIKSARMMSGTEWKEANIFDRGETNVIESMYNIVPLGVPKTLKSTLWNLGLVWAEPYDLDRSFFPDIQTIYDKDNSVLNNYFVAMALTMIVKTADEIWRRFTGNIKLNAFEFIDATQNAANSILRNKFAGIIDVVPETIITEMDKMRGYSWTMVFKLYANIAKTVMETYTIAYRK